MIKFALAFAPALLVATPVLASPADQGDGPTASLRIELTDLARDGGQQRLERRVARTARQLCARQGRTLADRAQQLHCVETALASVRPQVERAVALARSNQRLAATGNANSGR